MNKQELIELLTRDNFSSEDQKLVAALKERFPWFGLAKFIDLKMDHQLGNELVDDKVKKAAVYSSDRKFLYSWINNEVKAGSLLQHSSTELEFIDDSELIDEIAAAEHVEDENSGLHSELSIPEQEPVEESILSDETGNDTIVEDTIIAEASDDADEIPVPVEDPLTDIESTENERESEGEDTVTGSGTEDGDDIEVIVEKEDSELDHPELEESIPVPFIDHLEEEIKETDPDEEQEGEHLLSGTEDGSISDDIIQQEDAKMEVHEIEHIPPPEIVADIDSILQASLTKQKDQAGDKPVNLIEQFLQNEPGTIKGDSETGLIGDISEKSVKEDDGYITDTLAKIYVKQGLHAKAIYAYERLSLKYPEKSAYFAAQIEKIKSISNL